VNEAKPIKFVFDAKHFEFIFISHAHFSGHAVLIFNAKVEDVIILSHTKKLIWNNKKLIVFVVLNILGEDIGPLNDELIVTLFISPKGNTHISAALIF
jgi:hypothetical protein